MVLELGWRQAQGDKRQPINFERIYLKEATWSKCLPLTSRIQRSLVTHQTLLLGRSGWKWYWMKMMFWNMCKENWVSHHKMLQLLPRPTIWKVRWKPKKFLLTPWKIIYLIILENWRRLRISMAGLSGCMG